MGNSTSKDEAREAELLDLSLILITLELITSHLHEQQTLLHELLAALEKNEKWEMHKQNREKEKEKPKTKTFTQITASLRDNQFHRVFRMNRSSFVKFCSVTPFTLFYINFAVSALFASFFFNLKAHSTHITSRVNLIMCTRRQVDASMKEIVH